MINMFHLFIICRLLFTNSISKRMTVAHTIKSHPQLKKLVHRLLIAKGEAKPRLWVRLFVNRWFHQYGRGSKVRRYTRMDVLPFNTFRLGNHSTIENFCTINNGVGDVTIGNRTLVGMGNVVIGPVRIGNDVILAQNIVMSGLNHEYKNIHQPIHAQPITVAPIVIEDECWIGANAVITAGVTIGKHSVVAAGAVVTKSIPPYSVVAGNPAKVIKQYDAAMQDWIKVSHLQRVMM